MKIPFYFCFTVICLQFSIKSNIFDILQIITLLYLIVKKLLSISLILLIMFNAGGYFFIYFQIENHFKESAFNQINEFIPLENLELIKLLRHDETGKKIHEYQRLDEKEIYYHGKMYDIYKEEIQNDTVFLYCLNDEKEDILENAFAEYINKKNDDNSLSSVSNIIKILILSALQPNSTEFKNIQTHNHLSYIFTSKTQNIFIDIPSPPPKTNS
jgi:hypothetical protein